MDGIKIALGVIACILALSVAGFVIAPVIRGVENAQGYAVQKVDDRTNYETLQKVEDTCRAMISSYTADKLAFDQYKYSDNAEKQGWAEQAKMRANKTASTYNNYILENSFVWADVVPKDIKSELAYLE